MVATQLTQFFGCLPAYQQLWTSVFLVLTKVKWHTTVLQVEEAEDSCQWNKENQI